MRRFTASRSNILVHCNAWLADDAEWTSGDSAAASAGTSLHAHLAQLLTAKCPEQTVSHAVDCGRSAAPLLADVRVLGGRLMVELSLAWYPATDTAEVIGENVGRGAYDRVMDPTAITGTADVVVALDGVAHVRDWKSWAPGVEVDASDQLDTLALMVSRALHADTVKVATGLVGEVESRWDDERTLDVFALDAIAERRAERLAEPIAPPVAGPWCQYCPHRVHCPETASALAELVPADTLARHRLSTEIAGQEHAAWSLTAIDLVEEAVKAVKVALRAYADTSGGVVLPDGSTWAGHDVTTETPALDVPGALAEVKAAGGEPALEIKASWTALDKTLGKAKAKALRETLVAMGAVKASTHRRYEAKKPRKAKP